jgi:DNA-directed RNA polymerase
MLTRDDELGAMVNVLLGSEYASDVYSHFAESIRNRLKNLKSSEQEGVNIEKLKALIITRNCVKVVLMTYPYNSTTGGRRQMIEDVQFEKELGLYKQIKSDVILNKEEFNLYCNKIDISLKEFNSGLSGFLNTCTAWSSLFSGLNIHLEWLTLCNILTVQHHVELKEVVSHTEIRQQATTYRRYIKTELIDKRRQKSSFAANLIHSLDALHVLKVTLE